MTALDQAEDLCKQAITLLIQERDLINAKLEQLGFSGETRKAGKRCSNCGELGHRATTCTKKTPPIESGAPSSL